MSRISTTIFASAHPSGGQAPVPSDAQMQALRQALLDRASTAALAVVIDPPSATYRANYTPAPRCYRVVLTDAEHPLPRSAAAAGDIIELCPTAYPACPNPQRCLLLAADGGIDRDASAGAIDSILAGAGIALQPRAQPVAAAPAAAAAVAATGKGGLLPPLTSVSTGVRSIGEALASLLWMEDVKFRVCLAAFVFGVLVLFIPQYINVRHFRAADATILHENLTTALTLLEGLQKNLSKCVFDRGEAVEELSFLDGSIAKQTQLLEYIRTSKDAGGSN